MNGREPDRTKPAGKFAEGATSNVFVVTKGGIGREMEAKYYSNICVPARWPDVMSRSRGAGNRHALRKVESVELVKQDWTWQGTTTLGCLCCGYLGYY
jgi:hypothetical protein